MFRDTGYFINRVIEARDSEQHEQILDAAEQRVRRYGYRKTAMGEIAGDLNMSAANLYRFFENKEDIAAACAFRCMGERDAELRRVLAVPADSAEQRLTGFVLAALRYVYDQTHNHAHINELVETVVAHRPEVIRSKVGQFQAMLAQILTEGLQSGEFAVDDIERTAGALHHALIRFTTPTFMHLYTLEQMEQTAEDVVGLITRGLSAR